MNQPATNWETIGRHLAGEASPEESAEVQRWLAEHRGDAEFVAIVERMRSELRVPSVDVVGALRAVKARRVASRRLPWMASTGWTNRLELLATAATILLVVGVFAYRAIDRARGGAPEVTYLTDVGQRDSVRLADGTMVLLGPSSRLAVRDRDVELNGSGYFRVEHDARRPFTVRAAGSLIRDIGTEFAVDASGTDSAVRVVVSEGSVALSRGQDVVTLGRGDVGRAGNVGRVEVYRGAASTDDLAWTRGELIFRDTPLPRVAMDLRRWYGVEVRVSDSTLRNRHFTGSFRNESRDRVLDVLALALGASLELRGDTAILDPSPRRK
jgi:transmembrane sensor